MSELNSDTIREITPHLGSTASYSVLSQLRGNGRCRIYLAEREGKRYILKTQVDGDAKSLALLQREWNMSIGLSHPSLAYCFAYEESSPVGPCIVQEYVDGQTLSEWLAGKPSASNRKRVFSQLLSVVEYLHKKGVIHNDLSPQNILISRADNAVKLIDFGFADNDMQLSHSLGGTHNYSSPELLSGERVDARSDIWSLGALLRDVFPGRYRRIAAKAMRHNPERRYRSVEQFERAWKRYWLPLKLCAVVLALLCLASAFFLNQRRSYAEIENLSHQLDSVNTAASAREATIKAYKDSIDGWYDKAVPEFLEQLDAVTDYKGFNTVYSDFCIRMGEFNASIPERAPEEIRTIVRDHVIERYNSAVSSFSDQLMDKSKSLQSQ